MVLGSIKAGPKSARVLTFDPVGRHVVPVQYCICKESKNWGHLQIKRGYNFNFCSCFCCCNNHSEFSSKCIAQISAALIDIIQQQEDAENK